MKNEFQTTPAIFGSRKLVSASQALNAPFIPMNNHFGQDEISVDIQFPHFISKSLQIRIPCKVRKAISTLD
jgi:hypothetical protein